MKIQQTSVASTSALRGSQSGGPVKAEQSVFGVTVILCFLVCLCEGIDLQAAGVAASGIRAQYHPDDTQLTHFFAASTLGLFLGAAVGGRIADRVGRKAVLVWSVVAFGVFSLLNPLAWDVQSLIATRLLTGFGIGGAFPNAIALAAESAPANRRNANVTIIYAGAPLGGAIASLASLFAAGNHWPWIFVLGGVSPLLLAPVLALLLPESTAFLVARDRRNRATAESVLEILRYGRWRRTLLLWISFFLALLTLYLLLNWLPTLMVSSGLSKAQAAAAQVLFNASGALAAIYVGRHLETSRRRVGILLTFVAQPCIIGLLILVAGQVGWTFLVIFLLGAAILSAQAILYSFAPLCYPTAIRGTGVGFAVSMGRIGSIVGPLFGSMLLQAGRGPAHVLGGLLPIVVIGGLSAILLVWRPPDLGQRDSAELLT